MGHQLEEKKRPREQEKAKRWASGAGHGCIQSVKKIEKEMFSRLRQELHLSFGKSGWRPVIVVEDCVGIVINIEQDTLPCLTFTTTLKPEQSTNVEERTINNDNKQQPLTPIYLG